MRTLSYLRIAIQTTLNTGTSIIRNVAATQMTCVEMFSSTTDGIKTLYSLQIKKKSNNKHYTRECTRCPENESIIAPIKDQLNFSSVFTLHKRSSPPPHCKYIGIVTNQTYERIGIHAQNFADWNTLTHIHPYIRFKLSEWF